MRRAADESLFSSIPLAFVYPLDNFDSCTNLGFLHQFAVIWTFESKFMLDPN